MLTTDPNAHGRDALTREDGPGERATLPVDEPERPRRIALLTHAYHLSGGVPAVSRWLRDGLLATGGYTVDVHDLATARGDHNSRRLGAPSSWLRRSLATAGGEGTPEWHWGANAVEIEFMRYRPRRELTAALRNYDLVQVVCGSPAWAWPALGSGVPVCLQAATFVAWERGSYPSSDRWPLRGWRSLTTRYVGRMERAALRAADAVLVENQAIFQQVRALGQQRVQLAPPGVDSTLFSPGPGGWSRDGHLLSVCRLGDPRKGLDMMVHAYGELVRQRPDTPRLVLAGSGELPASVIALIAADGLGERVTVRPDVSAHDLIELYRGASVFLQTSHEEGLGIAALEAMACGLPVVATATHGARECVEPGVTGWLLPLDSREALSRAFAERVSHLLGGEGAAAGAAGRQRCLERFSRQAALRHFLDTYDVLLNRPLRSSPDRRSTR
ncbi:glycosyltransferase family 4 protein [Micromonospora sp. HUAS LYJ1]|uniref:glycosyltransferase family 4 protein n=1 Tax=Micromonospora sp. HUAS LYJ1 TaxID=3061626 RepID=UPI002671E9FD|nr:glycosyltransferase [Micromonospora sp. HUAS LYJ1]WKU05079.1 glycosyltransferase [Micromonospora sp. HUAS LYJ1]